MRLYRPFSGIFSFLWFASVCRHSVHDKKDEEERETRPRFLRRQQTNPLYPARPVFRDDCSILSDTTCSPNKNNRLGVCASVRGNGEKFLSHLISFARITEALGPIQAAAGPSSGGISAFLLESVYLNPYVKQCGADTCCTLDEQRVRISFLLKSMEGPLLYMIGEGVLAQFTGEIERIQQRAQAVVDAYDTHGAWSIQFVFELFTVVLELFDPGRILANFLNPEYVDMIRNDLFSNPANLLPHLQDIAKGFAALDGLQTARNDPLFFVRPSFWSYRFVLRKFDYLASFYAGYAPINMAEMDKLLDVCATRERVFNQRWEDIAQEPFSDTVTCGEQLIQIFQTFSLERSTLVHRSRLNTKPGKNFLVGGNAIFTGDSYDAWALAVDEYKNNPGNVQFKASFDDTRVGFFGDEETLAIVEAQMGILYHDDEEYAQRFLALGHKSWGDALLITMSEPGFGNNGQVIDASKRLVSTGGWIEGNPSQVLKAMGCDLVISNLPPDPSFGSFEQRVRFFLRDTKEIESAPLDTSYSAQDGVVCTDAWRSPPLDTQFVVEMSYEGDFMSNNLCVQSRGALPYQFGGFGERNSGCFSE